MLRVYTQVLDTAKAIMSQYSLDVARKKLRVNHYVAMLEDFGIPSKDYSEERGGKVVRLKAKALAELFWSLDDVVHAFHTYKAPTEDEGSDSDTDTDTSDSHSDTDSFYEEEEDSDMSVDSDEWTPDSLVERGRSVKRRRI